MNFLYGCFSRLAISACLFRGSAFSSVPCTCASQYPRLQLLNPHWLLSLFFSLHAMRSKLSLFGLSLQFFPCPPFLSISTLLRILQFSTFPVQTSVTFQLIFPSTISFDLSPLQHNYKLISLLHMLGILQTLFLKPSVVLKPKLPE